MNIALIGPMGVGKTTIGRLLADRLRLDFLDTDHEIEARTGADIPWIFDVEGEEGFRNRETAVLNDILSRSGQVIATGGGIIMREENRVALLQSALVIYLSASVDRILERTSRDRKRPLLQVSDPRARITELMEMREPLYREASHKIFSADGNRPRQLVSRILKFCESREACAPENRPPVEAGDTN